MVEFAKDMAGTALGIGAMGLVGESMSMLPGKKKKKKSLIGGAANLLVGTALLSGAAGIVKGM